MPGITPHSSGLQVKKYVCRGRGEDCAVAVEAESDAVYACARCGAAPGTRGTPESEASGGGVRRSRMSDLLNGDAHLPTQNGKWDLPTADAMRSVS